jgi:hypothetical protein
MDADIREATAAIVAVRDYLSQAHREAEAFSKVDRTALTALPLDSAAHSWIGMAVEAATSFDRRRHIYMFAIVALYGCLERLVEAYVTSHVRFLNNTVLRHDQLPAPVKLNNHKLTLSLLTRSLENRYHKPVDQKSLVDNLASCFQDAAPYRLNAEAFTYRASNCNSKQLWELLAQVGVPHGADAAGATKALFKHWAASHELGTDSLGAREATLWLDRYVDDLVARRNVLAHGGPVEDLESVELLEERAGALIVLSEILGELFASAAAASDLASGRAVPLGRPIEVFGNAIVAVRLSGISVRTGDALIAALNEGPISFRRGYIESIEVNHVRHEIVEAATPSDVALAVTFHAKSNYEYYLAPASKTES